MALATKMTHTYLRTHQISGHLLTFQLAAEQAALSEQAASSVTGRAGKTLVKEGLLRITMVALRSGTPLPSHHHVAGASLQVLRGRLRVVGKPGDRDIGPGALVALDAGTMHSAAALSDCVILITVAKL
jgi:quercetin dioxygenase-like cupin family protein